MATLIQSKQIEGVVTASVVEGDFLVSGSLVVSGSGIFTSNITASSISSSGPIYGVRYNDVQDTPNFVGGTGIEVTQSGNNITITNVGGGGGVPSGTISGSSQLTASFDSRYALSGSGGSANTTISDTAPASPNEGDLWWKSDDGNLYVYYDGYWVISVDYVSNVNITVPSGTISGSSQLTSSFDERYTLSGSVQPLPDGLLSGSSQLTSSLDERYALSGSLGGDTSFDGNRVVSNTLLGDLYSQSFNAGTSGSIGDFLNAVFFPQTAPTATFTDQTSKFNTNLATSNTNLVSVSLTDTIDNSPYTLTLSGASASSLRAVPTNAQSSSWEIRANSNLSAGTYTYDVTVGDSTNATRTYSGRTISILQATRGTLSANGTLYIIESATSGVITLATTGRPGSAGSVSVSYSPNYGSQVATNFSSSNALIAVNSTSGQLSVGSPISGSGRLAGSIISSSITYNDQYGNVGSGSISVNVTQNSAPTVTSILTTNNNTNQATGSTQILRLTISDTEGDSIPNSRLVWGNHNTTFFSASVSTPFMYLYANNTSIPAGIYPYTASLSDVHGFRTTTYSGSLSVSQADNGTLGGDTTNYIIESALSGAVLRDQTGFNAGNASQVSVSFSPNNGSQTVQTFTSSNPAIAISSTGHLSLAVNLSGSVTQSGEIITSTIGWADQYGNTDSASITVTVFGNNAPAVSFTNNELTDLQAISGSNVASFTITDTESNSPFSASIGGIDGDKFNLVPQNVNSSSYQIQPTGSLTTGTYSVQINVRDAYNESVSLTRTITVTQSLNFGKVYIYTSTRTASGTLNSANYLSVQGGSVVNSDVPPLVTSYTADTSSPFFLLKSGSIGSPSISVGGGTMTLRNTISGSDLRTIVSQSFEGSNGSETFVIVFPSGSDMVGTPTSMTDTLGGSTFGQYVMYVKTAGEGSFTIRESTIHTIQLDSSHLGFGKWNIIGRTGTHATTNYEIKLVPTSGSAP